MDFKAEYTPAKLHEIYSMLLSRQSQGSPADYAIYVDEFAAVKRTSDPDFFEQHEQFVKPVTQKVRILIYKDSSNRHHAYELHVGHQQKSQQPEQPAPQPQPALFGIEQINKQIEESLKRERTGWELETCKNEIVNLKSKLKEYELWVDELSEELKKYKSRKFHLGDVNLGEVVSVVAEGMIRRNTHLIAKIPGGAALAGVIEQDNQDRLNPQVSEPESEASFKRKSAEPDVDEETRAYLSLIEALEEELNEQEYKQLWEIVAMLRKFPGLIAQVHPNLVHCIRDFQKNNSQQNNPASSNPAANAGGEKSSSKNENSIPANV